MGVAVTISAVLFVIVVVMKYVRRRQAIVEGARSVDIKDQVVLIGIDGGCWDIMEPLIDQGKLPNIERLMRNGAYGDLIPESPYSPPSWTTIATGLSSKTHGVYHFNAHLPGKIERVLTTDNAIRHPTMWELLESEGKRAGVLGWLFVPLYPKVRLSRLNRHLFAAAVDIGYVLGLIHQKIAFWFRPSLERRRFLLENLRADWQIAMTSYLLKTNRPHFFSFVLRGSDTFQHFFWKYHYSHDYDVDADSVKKYGSAINDIHRKIDRFIGELMKKKDRNFMIVSDHGFLGFSRDRTQPLWLLHSIDYSKLLNKLEFLRYADEKGTVDWEGTKVYACGDPRVFHEFAINLSGREPDGAVSTNDYEKVRQEAREALEAIRFVDTGERLFTKISLHDGTPYGRYQTFHFMDEEYRIWNNDAFDILIEEIYECRFQDPGLLDREIIVGSKNYKLGEFVVPSVWSATHSTKGIFVANGRHIRPGRIKPISTMDIAPTLLHWMNSKVPESMEGKVQKEIFGKEFMEENPIRFSEKEIVAKAEGEGFSKEEEKRIKEDLRNLGYL